MRPFDRRLLARARAVRVALVVDVVAGVAGTMLLLVQATIIGTVVAGVVTGDGAVTLLPVVVLGGVVAARSGLAVVVERAGRRAATDVQSALRLELVQHRLRGTRRDREPLGGGDVAAVATAAVSGVDGLETYFARYLPAVVLAVVVPAAVLVWTAAVDVESALIMLVTVPLIPLFLWLIGRMTASRAAANATAMVTLSSHYLDVLRGLPTLRAFNRGRAQVPKLAESADRYRRTTMATLRLSFLSGFVLDLATTLSIALVAVTLGVRLVGGSLDLRPALIVLLLVPELYAPIRAVGALHHAAADGLAGAERILALLGPGPGPGPGPGAVPGPNTGTGTGTAEPARAADSAGGAVADPASVRIELHGVTVRYPGRAMPALDDVDLVIEPGTVVAVVGASGAGKTTLGRVLLGLTRPDDGEVVVGGRRLDDTDLDTWRTRVAWAAQRPVLVHGSVARNLALGAIDPDGASLEAAARAAGAHPFIAALPEGYATTIGPGGRGLSAGQRQRLGLARALARHAGLVVLDEPTAHLDADAARTVVDAVVARRGTSTVVVLTHDPHLAAVADRTVRLVDGRVRDDGDAAGTAAVRGEPRGVA